MKRSRKTLSMSGLLELVRVLFGDTSNKAEAAIGGRSAPISDIDCLMSGMAIFGLKYPSLLQFDKSRNDEAVKKNIGKLYGVRKIPSDTYLRERLDEFDPELIRDAFKAVFHEAQRGKALEEFKFFDDYYIVSADGTGLFESDAVKCNTCCKKEHRDGRKSYYHHAYCAAIVHPDKKTVIPLAPEIISRQDGSTKNDCELNALKRFLLRLRADHPKLKIIITADSLASKAPIIKLLIELKMNFIIGVKENDHKFLFEFVKHDSKIVEKTLKNGKKQIFRYANNMPLNESSMDDLSVNFLECTEIDKKGKKTTFSWVTAFTLNENNIEPIMRGGRARWKIENETFNTLKNQGYHFEHNFGHGYKYLCSVFAMLMLLVFLIDQIAQQCESLFQQALRKMSQKKRLWERLRGFFFNFVLSSWEDVWRAMIHGFKRELLQPSGP